MVLINLCKMYVAMPTFKTCDNMPQPKTELRAQFKFSVTITGIRYSSRCLTGEKKC